MSQFWRGILAAAIYILCILAATAYTFQQSTPPDGTIETLARLLPLQIVLVLICVMFVWRHGGWRKYGFQNLHVPSLIWLLPSIVVMGAMMLNLLPALRDGAFVGLGVWGWALLIGLPLLIGFGEEVMFRGIVLRSAMKAVPVVAAMMISSLLFAVMHAPVGLIGQAPSATLQNTLFAFIIGLFLAPVALRLGSLWPLIIWHAVWNMLVFASQIAGVHHGFVLIGILVQAAISVWLWQDIVRQDRSQSLVHRRNSC